MRQSLISMRELQLLLQCFKKTKFTSAFWIESMLPEFREASRSVILRAKRAEDHSSSDFLETEQNPLCPQCGHLKYLSLPICIEHIASQKFG